MSVGNIGSSIVSGVDSTANTGALVGMLHQMGNNALTMGMAQFDLSQKETAANMIKSGGNAMKDASKPQ